jgi:hypothetical protein
VRGTGKAQWGGSAYKSNLLQLRVEKQFIPATMAPTTMAA